VYLTANKKPKRIDYDHPNTASTKPSSTQSSIGLSSGSIGGIVAGAVVGGIVLTLAIFMAFWGGYRYNKKKEQERSANGASQQGAGPSQQLPMAETGLYFIPNAELDGRKLSHTVQEMDGHSAGTRFLELEG
jgi:hypothetical protein